MSIKKRKVTVMEDFNEFAKKKNKSENGADGENIFDRFRGLNGAQEMFDFVKNTAKRFDGKSQNDIMRAILEEAERGKKSGRLTNADIDRFTMMLSPLLDDKKRKYLYKIVERLKNIPDRG